MIVAASYDAASSRVCAEKNSGASSRRLDAVGGRRRSFCSACDVFVRQESHQDTVAPPLLHLKLLLQQKLEIYHTEII